MRKWNRTRLKSHGNYIYLIVYIWSLVYVTKQKKQVKVSRVSFTLLRTAFFFSHESTFRPYETNETAHLNRMFLKPLRVCTNLGKKRICDSCGRALPELIYNIPLQGFPSPVYPALHEHVYEPTVFWHTELTSQEWEPVVHSSKSKRKNHTV